MQAKAHRNRAHVCIHQRVRRYRWKQLQPVEKDVRGERFTDPAQGQRAKRHAQLHSRKKLIQIVLQFAHRTRARNPRVHHLLDPRIAHTHQGKFRGHKKGVDQNQHGHNDELQ